MNFQMNHELQRTNENNRYKDRVGDSMILGVCGGDYDGLKEQEKFLKSEYQSNFNAQSVEFKSAVAQANPQDYGFEKSEFLYIKRKS